jgi:hypothetical protein
MSIEPSHVLAVLDRCAEAFAFPALDNGYVYLAATRLALYRSAAHWALAVEVFGFSPRASLPDLHVYTFADKLHARDSQDHYASREAYERYLAQHPHNDSRFFYPIDDGPWLDAEDGEAVAGHALDVIVRSQSMPLPPADAYARHGIVLEKPPQVQIFELCRFLAAVARDQVLATPDERRVSVLPEMTELLRLEEWHHPDVVAGERPSDSQTFQQLARVLATGNQNEYRPSLAPNTDWRNWPGGGRL